MKNIYHLQYLTKLYQNFGALECDFLHFGIYDPLYQNALPHIPEYKHADLSEMCSSYLRKPTKCASKVSLLESVTLVPFHRPQTTNPFWRDLASLTTAVERQLIYVARLLKQWTTPTRLFMQGINYCLEEFWFMFVRKHRKPTRLDLCISEV